MNQSFINSVRSDLKHYAGLIDENARRIEKSCTDLAIEIEELNKNSTRYDISIDHMDNDYIIREDTLGNKLYIKTDDQPNGQMISLASGCQRVPVTPAMFRQLKLYENSISTMMRMYNELENVDEIWLFDIKSNVALGRIEYRFSEYILPGLDATLLYDFGITFYDWFKSLDKEQNPHRRALWSPMAFIEMFNQWVMNMQAPVYHNRSSHNEEMIATVAAHLKLDWVIANTIGKSAVRMMIIKDDSTLIGMNSSAKSDIRLETFDINNYSYATVFDPDAIQNKKRFVYETLNLEHNKPKDVVSFAEKVKSEFQFRHTLHDRTYTVVREKAPELGLNIIALLDDVE